MREDCRVEKRGRKKGNAKNSRHLFAHWELLPCYQMVHVFSPYLQWGIISSVAALSHLITSSVRRSSLAVTAQEEEPCVLLIWLRHKAQCVLSWWIRKGTRCTLFQYCFGFAIAKVTCYLIQNLTFVFLPCGALLLSKKVCPKVIWVPTNVY